MHYPRHNRAADILANMSSSVAASAYVRMRQYTSTYVSIHQHTSAYVSATTASTAADTLTNMSSSVTPVNNRLLHIRSYTPDLMSVDLKKKQCHMSTAIKELNACQYIRATILGQLCRTVVAVVAYSPDFFRCVCLVLLAPP